MDLDIPKLGQPKAIVFDLMVTCLDWHSSVTPILGQSLTEVVPSRGQNVASSLEESYLALEWRQGFFDEIHRRFEATEPTEDIDVTHRRVPTEAAAT